MTKNAKQKNNKNEENQKNSTNTTFLIRAQKSKGKKENKL